MKLTGLCINLIIKLRDQQMESINILVSTVIYTPINKGVVRVKRYNKYFYVEMFWGYMWIYLIKNSLKSLKMQLSWKYKSQ